MSFVDPEELGNLILARWAVGDVLGCAVIGLVGDELLIVPEPAELAELKDSSC